jgi:hypothetical protein
VKAALAHPSAAGTSDRQIAAHCEVNHQTVAIWGKRICQSLTDTSPRTVACGRRTYTFTAAARFWKIARVRVGTFSANLAGILAVREREVKFSRLSARAGTTYVTQHL